MEISVSSSWDLLGIYAKMIFNLLCLEGGEWEGIWLFYSPMLPLANYVFQNAHCDFFYPAHSSSKWGWYISHREMRSMYLPLESECTMSLWKKSSMWCSGLGHKKLPPNSPGVPALGTQAPCCEEPMATPVGTHKREATFSRLWLSFRQTATWVSHVESGSFNSSLSDLCRCRVAQTWTTPAQCWPSCRVVNKINHYFSAYRF